MNTRDTAFTEIGAWVCAGEDNIYEAVLLDSNGHDFAWLDRYGLSVTPEERWLAAFLFGYDLALVTRMGERIADAFLHGFISQSRDRAGRTLVRFQYQLGQEAIAKAAFTALKERGLKPAVQKPGQLRTADVPGNTASVEEWTAAYDAAFMAYADQLKNTCGLISLGQFGENGGMMSAMPGDAARYAWKARIEDHKRARESTLIPPSTNSFCKVAFPSPLVGERFTDIFDEVLRMNLVDSEPYERMQQTVIDVLDGCRQVRMSGRGGNRTDLTVTLSPLEDSEHQSLFLNCGGDLNIPYGELFTTPCLKGTSGRLHVGEIHLAGVPYRELELVFQDGLITEHDSADGPDYVRTRLLEPHDTLAMGEFAIGTNTRAYAIAEKYGLLPRIPILWLEKMGPHIAVGDPCFARGEDAPIFNLYDGKEMIARENERTARRFDLKEVYYNKHVDITLPFRDIGALYGITPAGQKRMIIQDGRFVLPGSEGLNEGLGEI